MINITVDGVVITPVTLPAGVSDYKLTGIAYNAGIYVVVGTKTVTPGNYRLLILTSTNGTTWTIDSEVDFASSYDPAISTIDVIYGNGEFIINGSTLQIITGVPGAWSAPRSVYGGYPEFPLKAYVYEGSWGYALFKVSACFGSYLVICWDDPVGAEYLIEDPYDDSNERAVFFADPVLSKFVISFHNSYSGKFVIGTTDLPDGGGIIPGGFTSIVNVTSNKRPAGFTLGLNTYIVGGNSTTSGIVYRYDYAWSDITAGELSLNGVAYNGTDKVLAVGYQGTLVELA